MNLNLMLDITCPHCGQIHKVPMDVTGHWVGQMPCDPTILGEVQINAEQFRELMEKHWTRIVH